MGNKRMGCSTPEVRRLIVKARKQGCSMKEITTLFEVSRCTVWRWTKRAYHPGRESYKDKPKRPHTIHRKITQEVENAIIILRDSFPWGITTDPRGAACTTTVHQTSLRNGSWGYLASSAVKQTKHQHGVEETSEEWFSSRWKTRMEVLQSETSK